MASNGKRWTTDLFIERARERHGDRFDYSEARVTDAKTPVIIICREHGRFTQSPKLHVGRGSICRSCSYRERSERRVLPTSVFVERARERHGDRYDYSSSLYVGAGHSITIRCGDHGLFSQLPDNHLRGSGCPKCARAGIAARRRQGTVTFVEQAVAKHGLRYLYTEVDYHGAQTLVTIICRQHGPFEQSPASHKAGRGCPGCATVTRSRSLRLSFSEFVSRSMNAHGGRFDYTKVVLRGLQVPVQIGCPDHGEFTQNPHHHMQGVVGCKACSGSASSARQAMSVEDFVRRARNVHGDYYDYGQVRYTTAHNPVLISCPEHGTFEKTPWSHLGGAGCPIDQGSTAERYIARALTALAVMFRREWSAPDLRGAGGRPLRFDFAIPSLRLLIEFDGPHHYRPVRFGSLSESEARALYERTVRHDALKTAWAESHGWRLARVASLPEVETLLQSLGGPHPAAPSVLRGGAVYCKNCTAVRAAGAVQVRLGDPGYGSPLDRDGDGSACG